MNLLKHSTLGIMAVAAATVGLNATADAQYFKGKRVNIIINYGAGGNTDIQGRMVMRHMKKYIKGNPRLGIPSCLWRRWRRWRQLPWRSRQDQWHHDGRVHNPIMAQVMKTP